MKYHHLRLHQRQLTSLHHEVYLLKASLILLHLQLQYHRHAFPDYFHLHHHQATHLKVRCCLRLAQSYLLLHLYLLKAHLKVRCCLHRFQCCCLLHSVLHYHQVIHQVMQYCLLRYLNLYSLHHQSHPIIHQVTRYCHLRYLNLYSLHHQSRPITHQVTRYCHLQCLVQCSLHQDLRIKHPHYLIQYCRLY